MNPLLVIDAVLSDANQLSLQGNFTRETLFSYCKLLSEITELDRTVIINKLLKDQYLTTFKVNDKDVYLITFEGVLHVTKGGYYKEQFNKNVLATWNIISSVFLALASIFAIVYYVAHMNCSE